MATRGLKRQRGTIPRRVREEVIETWGNDCWLELPVCTHHGEEDDHIIPFKAGGRARCLFRSATPLLVL